jgi:hypothetical protein
VTVAPAQRTTAAASVRIFLFYDFYAKVLYIIFIKFEQKVSVKFSEKLFCYDL